MERAAKILGGFKERDNPLHHVHSLTNIETFYKNNEAEIGKKRMRTKLGHFQAGKFKKN